MSNDKLDTDAIDRIHNELPLEEQIDIYVDRKEHLITDQVIQAVRDFLGEEGKAFFEEMIRDHGRVDAIFSVDAGEAGSFPHCVHFMEGMQVRNALRRSGLCSEWDTHDFDNLWVTVVEKAIQ